MRELGVSRKARARRRAVVIGATVIVVVVSGIAHMIGAFASGSASRPVDRDLSSYVLFAFDSINLKGDARTEVRGGNVGVNNADPKHGDQDTVLDMCRGGSGRAIAMDKNSQIVADSMTLSPACDVGYLFTNEDRSSALAAFVPLPPGPNVDGAGRG